MSRQFYTLRADGWNGPVSLTEVFKRAADQAKPGTGPFTRFKNHKPVGYKRQRHAALIAFDYMITTGKVGDAFSLHNANKEVLRVREAKPSYEVINTNGNAKIDKIWTAIVHEFTFPTTFLGAYVCKYIAGTWTMSQHSYGNAVDIGSTSMDRLHTIANWAVAHASELVINHVIVGNTVWTRGYGWSHYSGEYHYHVHIDAYPEQSGSCGVKG